MNYKHNIICLVLLLVGAYSLSAQDYSFSVAKVEMDVWVQPDGTSRIHYDILFENNPGAHAIDIVDVGTPSDRYTFLEAFLEGNRLETSAPSQYVKPGFEVHLQQYAIPPGGRGRFQVSFLVNEPLVFQDTTRSDYASFQITPTWFGSQYVTGTTDMTIRIHLPEGLQADEVLFQDIEFTGKDAQEDQVVVSWSVKRPFTGPYRVGVSFPKRVMTSVVKMSIPEMLANWYKSAVPEGGRIWIGIFSLVGITVLFFRFTGGTGCFFLLFLIVPAAIVQLVYPPMQLLIWPIIIVLLVLVERARRRRKAKYLPAIASVEGGGIKRGLTAPEAAVLLELPVNQVITLVLFGMLKKGLVRQVEKDPVIFAVEKNPPEDAIVQPYEKDFINVIRPGAGKPVQELDFSKKMKKLVEAVAAKMKSFDVEESRSYYRHIISRAWKEAETIGEIEAWQKKMDEKIDWMILDPNFGDRFRPYQDRYIPRSYRTFPSTSTGVPSHAPSGSQPGPRFSDVAASVAGWVQNTSEKVVGKIEGQKSGIIDFSAVDKAVGKAMASSGSGGGGGGGGSCACACAGCACACACAGGGR